MRRERGAIAVIIHTLQFSTLGIDDGLVACLVTNVARVFDVDSTIPLTTACMSRPINPKVAVCVNGNIHMARESVVSL